LRPSVIGWGLLVHVETFSQKFHRFLNRNCIPALSLSGNPNFSLLLPNPGNCSQCQECIHVYMHTFISQPTCYTIYLCNSIRVHFVYFVVQFQLFPCITKRFRDNDVVGWYNIIDRFDLTTRMETIEANYFRYSKIMQQ
jgi:hypothetical protein